MTALPRRAELRDPEAAAPKIRRGELLGALSRALDLTGGNRTATAELLGLSRQSLYVKLDRYGLDGDSQKVLTRSG